MEILLGVTGCIGAYKVPELIRLLRRGGAGVTVILTRHAGWFVAEGTLQTLSERPVYTDMFKPRASAGVEHIDLARQADLMLVAPATANVLGKLAHGIADDFLTTVHLAYRGPLMLAPAMNSAMYRHPAVQSNLEILRARGAHLIGPGEGELACGETGEGRLMEPEAIAAAALAAAGPGAWGGRRVLVTSGPTREPIDPVRFISNPSSGRMGHALAAAAAGRGARVTLVTGPVALPDPFAAEVVRVSTVEEMMAAVTERAEACDLVLMAAAVGDYLATTPSASKIKKTGGDLTLTLRPAPDILAELGRRRAGRPRPILVGFAAETDALESHARGKLTAKGLDLIVANPVGVAGAGFADPDNQVTILAADGGRWSWPSLPKGVVAERLLDLIGERHFGDAPGPEPC